MIIKSIRTRTATGVGKLIQHVLHGDENERVQVLHGTEADVRDMHNDAKSHGSTYAVRHWIISPRVPITRQQLLAVVKQLGAEFEFEPRQSVIVEHKKIRALADAADIHWHLIIGETDPATGRILRSSYDHILHELVARLSEYQFGHPVVLGKHNKAVVAGLKKRGFCMAAERLEGRMAESNVVPHAAYSHCQHQEKKRKGINLPAARLQVQLAFRSASSFSELLETLAAKRLFVGEGDKPNTWIVTDEGDELIGALHRLAGVRRSEVDALKGRLDSDSAEVKIPATEMEVQTVAPPDEKIMRHLQYIEDEAVTEINSAPPSKPPYDKAFLQQELSDAQVALKAAQQEQSVLTDLLFATSPKWWWRLTGKLAKWQAEKPNLEKALAEKDRRVAQTERKVSVIALRQRHAASVAESTYAASLQKHREREQAARRKLSIVEAAREIIATTPDIAKFSFAQVLMQAERKLDRQHLSEQSPKFFT